MTDLVPQQHSLMPTQASWNQMLQMGQTLLKSGFLPQSIKTPEAAVAIMLTGYELGISPMRAFSKISVISGKPALGAELLLSRVYERYPNADIEVVKREADGAILKARRDPKKKYVEFAFLLEDAKRAECLTKDSWKKWPKAMYYWRAVSDMVRSIWPECLGPASHTPEELGAEVNEDGDVIDVESQPSREPIRVEPIAQSPAPTVTTQRTASNAKPQTEPKKAVLFNFDDRTHQEIVMGILKKEKVDEALWETIGKKLHGRPLTDLPVAKQEVFAQ